MKPGFVPALGTPLDKEGNLISDSLKKHIDDQINAGAVGLLCMGSMGKEAFIRDDVYPEVARTAVEANAGRVKLFIGAMDTCIERVKQRIAPLEDLEFDGLVLMAPFYSVASRSQILNFIRGVAKLTKHKILIYDLPSVCQAKITYDMVLELIETVPNFGGIKSADTVMFRKLKLNPAVPKDFIMVYSGLDMFDVAYKWGIDNCLDGMLSCTPYNTKMLFESMAANDYAAAAEYLNNILALRDCFRDNNLMPAFTKSMNMLGYDGDFAQDYCDPITDAQIANVRAEMVRIGEIKK